MQFLRRELPLLRRTPSLEKLFLLSGLAISAQFRRAAGRLEKDVCRVNALRLLPRTLR